MNKLQYIAVVFLTFIALSASAQSASVLRINEIMVHNDSNIVDEYGNHISWIEIFNTSHNSVTIGGLFITDDLSNPTKSIITKCAEATIPPRGYYILYATGNKSAGVKHLAFNLKKSKIIALFDANGRTLIDSITIPPLAPDIAYGRISDGSDQWTTKHIPTPNASNWQRPFVGEVDTFKAIDPYGIGMTVIAISIVLTALFVLYICFKLIGKIAIRKNTSNTTTTSLTNTDTPTDEEIAAIAMALHLYQKSKHDDENAQLTIKRVTRNYSPWNSKIHNMRKRPNQHTTL